MNKILRVYCVKVKVIGVFACARSDPECPESRALAPVHILSAMALALRLDSLVARSQYISPSLTLRASRTCRLPPLSQNIALSRSLLRLGSA